MTNELGFTGHYFVIGMLVKANQMLSYQTKTKIRPSIDEKKHAGCRILKYGRRSEFRFQVASGDEAGL